MSETHLPGAEPDPDGDLFVEFANTLELDDGIEQDHLPDGAALRSWLRAHELCGGDRPVRDVGAALGDFRDLRALLHEVTARVASGRQPTRQQVGRINAVLRDGLHYHQLELRRGNRDGGRYAMGHVGSELAQARATIAGSLAHYLAEHDLGRMRVCANDGCRWRFIDRSPSGRRRWCDMRTCGNRAKVARHRAKERSRAHPTGDARAGATIAP